MLFGNIDNKNKLILIRSSSSAELCLLGLSFKNKDEEEGGGCSMTKWWPEA